MRIEFIRLTRKAARAKKKKRVTFLSGIVNCLLLLLLHLLWHSYQIPYYHLYQFFLAKKRENIRTLGSSNLSQTLSLPTTVLPSTAVALIRVDTVVYLHAREQAIKRVRRRHLLRIYRNKNTFP